MNGVMLQACLNGARDISHHPRLSTDPAALAQEAAAAVAAGAQTLHVHPKNSQGQDTLEPQYVAAWLSALRKACPGTPLGVTTGAWSSPDAPARLEMIRSWYELPDFASVNWHEEGAEEVAALLHHRGVAVEAGIWQADAARKWASSPLKTQCLRVLIEVQDVPAETVESEAVRLLELVKGPNHSGSRQAFQAPVLLHGEEGSAWAAVQLAARWGLGTRIGLEDTLLLPDGRRAGGNADLIVAAKFFLAM
ncbi:3-keto-5-aminohexanoate cleavage protein [Paenarthrobacter aurescens]|nr:3-keto-5-aminohexanoate cleavage protein [Paenarthrobacter aurescens]MDO6146371.1 3-keto-5-aminohexanoate cleavage protein [Paenarthrobacter aurescens]MDO6157616.1 3-keto-5-aminohexanoate cleavage protein [Paenarthrobacter aurescens]MDO6161601.1 3-keto-5-aminohexanoate cleavage protein [Paenarthrobacter aurescens]